MKVLRQVDLELDMSSVLWCQGEDPSGQLSPRQQEDLSRKLLPEARRLLEPVIVYDLFPVREVRNQELVIGEGAILHGHLLADRFILAEEVALALCTIGGKLEKHVSAYRDTGDEGRAILLDGIGTAAVTELARRAHELVVDVAQARGWQGSAPFQPGQLDWPLEDHRVFFELLSAQDQGLSLDSHHLMRPSKSVSLAVALGKEMLALAMERACKYCSLAAGCRFSRQ